MVPWKYQFEGPRNSQIRSEEKKSLKMESIMFHINVISSHEYQKDIAKQSKEKGEEKNGEYGCSRYYTKLIQWPGSISPTFSFGQLNSKNTYEISLQDPISE